MPLVEVNGAETFYEVAGTGSPVVLLHSGLADSRSWDPQFASWSRERLVVRYDLRGFGRSSLPPGPYSLVDDLRALLDHLTIERTALAGLSLGGRVALDFTLTHPDRVGALVLAGSGLGGFEWSKELASVMGREDDLLDAGDLDGATELMLETWVAGPRRALEDVDPGLRSTIAAMQREAYEVLLRAYSGPEQPGPGAALDPPASDRLGEVRAPTLVLVGDEEVDDVVEIAEILAQGIQGAEQAVIPGAAHMLNLERPAEFDRRTLAFLDRVWR